MILNAIRETVIMEFAEGNPLEKNAPNIKNAILVFLVGISWNGLTTHCAFLLKRLERNAKMTWIVKWIASAGIQLPNMLLTGLCNV